MIDEKQEKSVKLAEEVLHKFPEIYQEKWLAMMRAKLGLFGKQKEDTPLIVDLLDWMHKNHLDYTNTFLDLSLIKKPLGPVYEQKFFDQWYQNWQKRRPEEGKTIEESISLMKQTNPVVIPRNHKVEEVLTAANEGDYKLLEKFVRILSKPYEQRTELTPYQNPPKDNERVYQTFCGT